MEALLSRCYSYASRSARLGAFSFSDRGKGPLIKYSGELKPISAGAFLKCGGAQSKDFQREPAEKLTSAGRGRRRRTKTE